MYTAVADGPQCQSREHAHGNGKTTRYLTPSRGRALLQIGAEMTRMGIGVNFKKAQNDPLGGVTLYR